MTRRMLRVAGVALAVAFTVLVVRPSGQAPAARRRRAGKTLHLHDAADPVGRSGHPGNLEQRDDHAARASARSGREGTPLEGRGRRGQSAVRHSRHAGAAPDGSRRGCRARLRPVLVGPRQVDRPDLAHLRPGGRPSATAHRARPEASRRTGRGSPRARRVRLIHRPPAAGALHHVSRRAAAPDRLQQQLRNHAGARRRGDSPRGDPRGPDHPARRPSTRQRLDPPVAGRFARPLGRRHARRRDDELPARTRGSDFPSTRPRSK